MEDIVLPCPWGRRSVDLSKLKLSNAEKLWFAQEIIDGIRTPKYLAENYKIPVHNLRRWVRDILKGKGFQTGPGRPPYLSQNQKEKNSEFLKVSAYAKSEKEAKVFVLDAIKDNQVARGLSESQAPTPSRSFFVD